MSHHQILRLCRPDLYRDRTVPPAIQEMSAGETPDEKKETLGASVTDIPHAMITSQETVLPVSQAVCNAMMEISEIRQEIAAMGKPPKLVRQAGYARATLSSAAKPSHK